MKPQKLFLLLALSLFLPVTSSASSCDSCYDSDCDLRGCDDLAPGFLPPSQPYDDECGFFVGGDILYWRACEDDLDYVQEGAVELSTRVISGKRRFVEYCYDPGFRLLFGFRKGCDGWDARAIFTYFQTDGSNTVSDDSGNLDPILVHEFNPFAKIQKASAKRDLTYKTFDLLFTRPYCVSETLIARPFFGFRTLWLDRDYEVIYFDHADIKNHKTVSWDSDFCGYGINTGLEWNVGLGNYCGSWSLNVDVAGSLMVGEAKQKQTQVDDCIFEVTVNESQCLGVPGYHVGTNLMYENCFDCVYLFMSIGYEANVWQNLPQVRRFFHDGVRLAASGNATSGEVLLHGMTLRGELHF